MPNPAINRTRRFIASTWRASIRRAAPVALLGSHHKRRSAYHSCAMGETFISVDPQIQGGVPVFAGTRVPVKNLFDYLEGGESLDQFLDDFPSVKREVAVAVLEQAREAVTPHAHPA